MGILTDLSAVSIATGKPVLAIAEKAVPRRQREAELRFERAARDLIAEGLEGALDARIAGYRGQKVSDPLLAVSGRLGALLAAEGEQAAIAGRNRVVQVMQRRGEGGGLSYGQASSSVLERVRLSSGPSADRFVRRLASDLRAAEPGEVEALVRRMMYVDVPRFAETEMNDFQNASAYEAMIELRISYHKWVSRGDHRVRGTHRTQDGEIVRVGDRFSNGLLFPGDRSTGEPKEYVRCRCVLLPFFLDGRLPPVGAARFYEHELAAA